MTATQMIGLVIVCLFPSMLLGLIAYIGRPLPREGGWDDDAHTP